MLTSASTAALTAFLSRLLRHSPLNEVERAAVLGLHGTIARAPRRIDLVAPGRTVDHAILVAEGTLGRFDLMRSGTRQITAIHLPGDMCDLHSVVAPRTGWGFTALTEAVVVKVAHDALRELAMRHPGLALAFWRDTTLDSSILAKWVANIGRKDARARIAHLLCELAVRMEQAGLGTRAAYPLGLTQEQIGDVMGLTAVHVNRTTRSLRDERLVEVEGRQVTILDWNGLAGLAEFDPAFLLGGQG